jgi:TrmH family RNA methyltransferase
MQAGDSRLRFVLLRPQISENLGSVARALKNFGFDDWVVVTPEARDLTAARRLAVQSQDVLDRMREAPSLDAAIADCVWVVGTTSRQRRGRTRLPVRNAARSALERSKDGTVAIVFGDERSGLTNEELDRCHATSTAPSSAAQPSLNLAQAVLLYAYELRMAALEQLKAPAPARQRRASDGDVRVVEDALQLALSRGGFLHGQRPAALRDLTSVLQRAVLTEKEAKLWTAALRSLAKRLPEP